MQPNSDIFAGIDISSGRKPVTFVALDDNLKVASLERWSVSEALSCLKGYENIYLVINFPSSKRGQAIHTDFKNKISQVGFESFSNKNSAKQWLETKAQDCFRALGGQTPLPRRTLGGQIQRALILYDQGLQIKDPMEFFEEITRHKLIQGMLPLENLYTPRELDALASAYLAWMAVNRSAQLVAKAEFLLPSQE
jgi:hypothetical protein